MNLTVKSLCDSPASYLNVKLHSYLFQILMVRKKFNSGSHNSFSNIDFNSSQNISFNPPLKTRGQPNQANPLFVSPVLFNKPCEKPIIEFTRLSCQLLVFSLNIKYFNHKQMIIKHRLTIINNL